MPARWRSSTAYWRYDGDDGEEVKGSEVRHGELGTETPADVLVEGCRGCSEDDAINVEEEVRDGIAGLADEE